MAKKLDKQKVLASYKDILIEVGRNLAKRKGNLAARTALIMWPMILLVGVATILSPQDPTQTSSSSFFDNLSPDQTFLVVVGFLVLLALVYVYTTIMRLIFHIEKNIWVDSYFDKRNLTTRQSWRIAYKLIWPAAELWLNIAMRYYVLPIILWAIAFYADIFYIISIGGQGTFDDRGIPVWQDPIIIGLTVGFTLSAILAIYLYYVTLRLRFVWFILLDTYGTDKGAPSDIVHQQERLNKSAESIGLKRAIITDLSGGLVGAISTFVADMIILGAAEVSHVSGSKEGEAFTNMARTYTQELTQQAASLGTIAAMYILYREARKAAGDKDVTVNEALYKLAK